LRIVPPPPSSKRPKLPPEIDKIILKCVQLSPDDRYESFEPIIEELTAIKL